MEKVWIKFYCNQEKKTDLFALSGGRTISQNGHEIARFF